MKRLDQGMNLQQRLLLLGLLPCVSATILLTSYFTFDKIRTLEAAFADSGAAAAQRLASSSDSSLSAGDAEALRRICQQAVSESGIDSVAISNAYGIQVSACRSGAPLRQTRSFSAAVRARTSGALGDVAADAIGSVQVVLDSSRLHHQERQSAMTGVLLGLASLLAAMAVARRLARGIVTPLRRLGEAVALIRSGDLGARSRLRRDDELGRLSAGIDDMAAALAGHRRELEARVRLATREAQQRISLAEKAHAAQARFLAATSHDLRQPLHAVGLFVGRLRETASIEQLPLLSRIDEGLAGMAGLLGALLDISRLDAGVVEPQRSVVAITRLPLAAKPAAVAGSVTTAPEARAQGRALVVEDDSAIREGTIGLLEQWGLSTASAGSAEGGAELLQQAQPAFDYLLCDLQLHEIDDGWRVIEAARRVSAMTRLLLISGDTAAATLRRARENGVIVLTKPVTPAKLRAALGPIAAPGLSTAPPAAATPPPPRSDCAHSGRDKSQPDESSPSPR